MKMMIEYRFLRTEDLCPELFAGFQRHQKVNRCWYREHDRWALRDMPRTIENWGEKELAFICWCLGRTIADGGLVTGAFVGDFLKGIVSVESARFGSRNQYMEIPFLQVSEDMRGNGIGRQLFAVAKVFAAEKGAEKLYISSNPAEETQAFYRAVGCVEAEEYSETHVQQGPFDCQIECQC